MSSRDLTAGMLSAIAAGTVRPAILYEGIFVSGGVDQYLRLWSGVGDLSWNGHTWTGSGELLGLSSIEEAADIRAVGFTITLSGMSAGLISNALSNARQGKAGTLWLALFDASGAVIADPYQLQSGRLDFTLVEDAADTCTIGAQYESRMVDLEKPRERRYTNEDQQLDYPADRGFEYMPSLQDMQIVWGR